MAIRISKDRVKLDIPLNEAKGADIASASSIDLGAATGNFVDITGTTGITSLGTADAGIRRIVRFNGTLTLTHNATSLILPGNGDITTASGDIAEFVSLGSGNWTCSHYTKDTGEAVVTNGTNILSAQTSDYTLQPGDLAGTLVVPIDISSGDVPISEQPLADMSGLVIYTVVADDDADVSSKKAEVKDDNGNEVWTGVRKNDFFMAAYDGTNRRVLDHRESFLIRMALTADQSISADSYAQLTGWTVLEHYGSMKNTDQVDAPFYAEVTGSYSTVSTTAKIIPELRVDAQPTLKADQFGTASATEFLPSAPHLSVGERLSSGAALTFYGYNPQTSTANSALGDGADETQIELRFRRLYQ